ncbi:MAG: YbjP/YqhG family protein [Verrucomicrobiota bacterium]|nr:YbjP/YqhG family protein [Verrucomicrobiota bacterium]
MKPVLIAVLLLMSAAFSCGETPAPAAIVRELYQMHDAETGPFFDRQNREMVGKYFTRELSELIVKDADAADDEVGALDFDPLYETQDPQITGLTIRAIGAGQNGDATVEVSFNDSGKPRLLKFRMQQDATKAWKIADIIYSDGRTLAGILRDNG